MDRCSASTTAPKLVSWDTTLPSLQETRKTQGWVPGRSPCAVEEGGRRTDHGVNVGLVPEMVCAATV